ncbi:hypothetical protein DPMN_118389 [Dreissena polymorpha]|uniref:Uncharacterized protein n=1 Tax=Dreissena polymorpha TaxID=45954 RepID=A0A9D4GGU3_DREPO|nr:hypothetical protein DPMN_118389 [Dreissena polymorpha]
MHAILTLWDVHDPNCQAGNDILKQVTLYAVPAHDANKGKQLVHKCAATLAGTFVVGATFSIKKP